MAVNPAFVQIGPGLVFAAPAGTAEPLGNVATQATLPAAWRHVGGSEDGSTVRDETRTEPVWVEEEFYPVIISTVSRTTSLALQLAETTRQNLALAVNAGANAANDATAFEPPAPATEVRVMMVLETESGARWLFRKCIQTETVQMQRRKAPNKALMSVRFTCEKPAGLQPWKVFPSAAGLI